MPSARPDAFALTSPGALRLYSTAELFRMPPPTWIVDKTIPLNALVGLYGPPGVGKSFLAIDLALCVATGLPWHERCVQKGPVLYVSAEGVAGLGQRVKAWILAKGLDVTDPDIAWLPEAVAVSDDSDHLDTLFERFDELPEAPSVVVLDTLARCFPDGGDENQQQDMGRFIKGIDKIRHSFGSTVIAVHHSNAADGRERGSTAFRGAADAMLRVLPGILGARSGSPLRAPQGAFTVLLDKLKDAEVGPVGVGRLRQIAGTTSCVADIEWLEAEEG